jgi:hypothetical protein
VGLVRTSFDVNILSKIMRYCVQLYNQCIMDKDFTWIYDAILINNNNHNKSIYIASSEIDRLRTDALSSAKTSLTDTDKHAFSDH